MLPGLIDLASELVGGKALSTSDEFFARENAAAVFAFRYGVLDGGNVDRRCRDSRGHPPSISRPAPADSPQTPGTPFTTGR